MLIRRTRQVQPTLVRLYSFLASRIFDFGSCVSLEAGRASKCETFANPIGCRIEPGSISDRKATTPATHQPLSQQDSLRMDDGKFIEDAFVYDWRLWSPAECCDLLKEVGFADIKVQSYPDSDETEDDGRSKTVLIFGFKQS